MWRSTVGPSFRWTPGLPHTWPGERGPTPMLNSGWARSRSVGGMERPVISQHTNTQTIGANEPRGVTKADIDAWLAGPKIQPPAPRWIPGATRAHRRKVKAARAANRRNRR